MGDVKERPIIATGNNIVSILNGIKIQTRRVMRPQIDLSQPEWKLKQEAITLEKQWRKMPEPHAGYHIEENMWGLFNKKDSSGDVPYTGLKCPYGKIGDELWVRETIWGLHETEWCEVEGRSWDHGSDLSLGKEFHSGIDYVATPEAQNLPELKYKQTVEFPEKNDVPGNWWLSPPKDWDGHNDDDYLKRGEWVFLPWELFTKHPSIHMPRWASRLQLRIKDIRVERVQDISEKDAVNEGVLSPWDGMATDRAPCPNAIKKFTTLWDSLNAKRGFGWGTNCWVWVIEFERIAA